MASVTSLTALELLGELKSVSESFKATFGIEIVGLAGSRARGDAVASSDVDVAVRPARPIGLGTIVEAQDWLKGKLGLDVDLVFFDALPDYKKPFFLKDMREIA